MRSFGRRSCLLETLLAALLLPLQLADAKKKYSVTREDIVIAFPADTRHIEVARSSRVWRKVRTSRPRRRPRPPLPCSTAAAPPAAGARPPTRAAPLPALSPQGTMRTFIANNVPPPKSVIDEGLLHNETWGWYPDDVPKR